MGIGFDFIFGSQISMVFFIAFFKENLEPKIDRLGTNQRGSLGFQVSLST
jgi:hypothetical protein